MTDHHRFRRNRNIRHALVTSAAARFSGVLLQVVSLPIAAGALGHAGFSIYAMLGAFLAAMTLSNLGMGQATTLHLSRSLADDDIASGRAMLAVSLVIVGGIAIAASLIVAGLILWSSLLDVVFSRHLDGTTSPTGAALFVCLVFLATQLLSVFEAAQLAQQRQHRLNVAMSAGTLVAATAVWWVAAHEPSVLAILVAVHLPVLFARGLNAVGVWADLRPSPAHLALAAHRGRAILADGLRFVSGTTIANFLCHPFSVLVVGLFAAPMPSASFAAVMNAVLLASAVFGYVLSPLRGSLPEAQTRHDHEWIRRAYRLVMLGMMGYAVVPASLLSFFGIWLFDIWYGPSVEPSGILTFAAGVYVLLLGLEMVNFAFASSLGSIRIASRWMLAKGIVSAASVLLLAGLDAIDWTIWSLCIVNLGFSLIPLSYLASRVLIPRTRPEHA